MAEATRGQPADRLVEPVVGGSGLYRSGEPDLSPDLSAPPENLPPLLDHTEVVEPPVFRPPDGIWSPWAVRLRRFARTSVWALPFGMAVLALAGVWGWPTPSAEGPQSPGTWLVTTLVGLVLAVIGVVALTALLCLTQGAPWAMASVVLVVPGTVLLASVLGVIGVARPAASRLGLSNKLEGRYFDGELSRWLGVGSLVLLGAGFLCLAVAVLASRILNRIDAGLLAAAVGLATLAAYAHWQFLVVLAAMLALAGALGLAFTASRLNPDGVPPPD
jgi:hypothetical protein